MTKTYQLTTAINFNTYVFVDGNAVFVSFVGSPGHRGILTVSDEKLQKALEADSNFGFRYTLVNEKEEVVADNSEEKGEADNEIQLKEVTAKNLQGINDLVKELFPEYGKSFKNSEKAVEYFKERGYNLVIE